MITWISLRTEIFSMRQDIQISAVNKNPMVLKVILSVRTHEVIYKDKQTKLFTEKA